MHPRIPLAFWATRAHCCPYSGNKYRAVAKERLDRPPCWGKAGEPKGRLWLLRVLWCICINGSFAGPHHYMPHSLLTTSSFFSFFHLHLLTQDYNYNKWLWLLRLLCIWPDQYRQVTKGSYNKSVHAYWLWTSFYLCSKLEPIPTSRLWSELV